MKHGCAAVLALAAAMGAAATAKAEEPALAWTLRPGADEVVRFRGVLGTDRSGAEPRGGSMTYPGGAGVAGLLVGVLTHAAIVSSTRSAEKERIQQAADEVLTPRA